MNPARPQALYLAGPTAVGKSEVALALAERLQGEIVSVDSMQVYRGLDIGTAKPGPEERRRIPHHLIDVVDLAECFDAARFVDLATGAARGIRERGRLPIFCGGTGLYFRALLEGLGEAPPGNPALRAELEASPLEVLLAELRERDPETFAKLDRRNPRRVIRAVEVIRLTGRPFAAQRAGWSNSPAGVNRPVCFALCRASGDLRQRIEARVENMFALGLVEETRGLLARGLAGNRTAAQAIGYRQVVAYLRGERSLPDTVALVKQKTRQLARRQLTWFRHQGATDWVPVLPSQSAEAVAARVAERFRAGSGDAAGV